MKGTLKHIVSAYYKTLEKVACWLPEPKYTRLRNRKLYDWMNQNAPGKKVLNLGSGIGNFDNWLSEDVKRINLDIDSSKPSVDIIGDGHCLPFRDGAFDIVYSIAVLEHVRKPWIVSEEIYRVLRKGGHVVLELPFLNVIHDHDDYFRFSDRGIRVLFDETRFDVVLDQVGSGGGSFLSVFLFVYLRQFIWGPLRVYWVMFTRYFFCLLRYLDVAVNNSDELRLTANSFTFIGKKV